MRGPALVILAIWLLGACDTVKRANDAQSAYDNCVVLAELSDELCEPDDPTTLRVHCAWTRRQIWFYHAPPPAYYAEPSDPIWSCEAALEVAEEQCEAGSTADWFEYIGDPSNYAYAAECPPELDPLVDPECFTWAVCM
ncbi:hypothetical protein L6R49_06020 [Myxococcota bacterium]|nr:hypothetical protein [Myxococcota bacterium]